jgi:hypothetical protein
MSNFIAIAQDKKTGWKVYVEALDDYFDKRQYGYKIEDEVLTEEEFNEKYYLLLPNK